MSIAIHECQRWVTAKTLLHLFDRGRYIVGMDKFNKRYFQQFVSRISQCRFPRWIHFLQEPIGRSNACQVGYQREEALKVTACLYRKLL